MNQKSILFFSLFCLLSFTGFSQIISTEGFESTTYPPTGWSIKVPIAPPGTNVWIRQTSPTTNPTATAHSGSAVSRFRSRNVAAGTKQILITRQIDYTNRGTSAANLDFWMYRDNSQVGNIDSITVWVNNTDTIDANAIKLGTIARNRTIAIPDTQATNAWYHFIYAIPASFTGTTTRFIFEGTSETAVVNQGANIYIDDVSFDEFPAMCTGIPNVGNIVNNNPMICGGGGAANLALSSPIVGFSGITYAWESSATSSGPWTATGSNTSTLSIPSITASTYYRCTVTCSFSSSTYTTSVDSIMISSNTPPTVSVTPTNASFCVSSSGVQLIASGATTYAWTPAAGLNATNTDTVMASPSVNTQYIVTGTDSVGCTDTALVNVTINNGPTVAITANPNDSVFCIGSQVILNSVPANNPGNTYLWSDGKTTRRDTITVTGNTTYSVVVTNGGCSNSDSFDIISIPGSSANFGWTSAGNTYTFSDSSTTATNWTWDFGDGNGSSNQNPVYTYSNPGTYTVTLIISGTPCNDADTISKVILIAPTGVSNMVDNLQLRYYPNPVKNNLIIELKNEIITSIIIRNNVGQKLASYINENNNSKFTLPTSQLSAGIYFADALVNGQTIPFKFVKE